MDTKPLISIITCFLNVGLYIEETIESVLKQEYANWELILIDDGSTDKSTNIAKDYATIYSNKIFYLEHENHANRGSSISRNLGIQIAKGTLITFLDADDVWLPGMLSELLNLMQQYPVTLICEASEYWYDWNNADKTNEVVLIGSMQNRVFSPPELMLTLYPLGNGAAPCICGMLVTKETVDKYGAFDESFGGMYDDQSFLVKFYLHEAVYISSSCNNKYRQRPESLVHSSHGKNNYFQERKYFLTWLKDYLKRTNVHYPEVNYLLQQALLPYQPITGFVKLKHTFSKKAAKALQKIYKMIKR